MTLSCSSSTARNGTNIQRWNLRDTLAFSRDDQPDFVVEIDENDRAFVLFGDGKFGQIPPLNAVIKATYRIGGGAQGNVPARTIETIANAPAARPDRRHSHERCARHRRGRARAHRARRAPGPRRVPLAQAGGDERRLRGAGAQLPGRRQGARGRGRLERRDAARRPGGRGQYERYPADDLLAYFEDKRPITTRIEIAGVDYVSIYVTACIGVEAYYDREDVRSRVQTASARLLAFDQVRFAQPIYLSKFYEAIEAVDGVRYATITEFNRDRPQSNNAALGTGKIVLEANEIPCTPPPDKQEYAGGIKVVWASEEGV